MRYRIKVLRENGVGDALIDAKDAVDLEKRVREQGMTLIAARADRLPALRGRRTAFSVSLFTQELVALLEAGLSIIEALETLREKSSDPASQQVLNAIVDDMFQGLPLSAAFSRQPDIFPALYIATVASSEKTGHIANALRRYQHYETRLAAVRKKIVSAMVYPALIVTIGGAILLFLLFYVVPKFSQIYEDMKNLPLAARLMLDWGRLVHAHGTGLFLLIVATLAAGIALLRDARFRAGMMQWLFSLPSMAHYRRLLILARFYRSTSLLLSGGMPAVVTLEMTAQLLPQDYRTRLMAALDDIRAGQPLSAALPRHALCTPVAERLLRVGEQSGELPEMAERIAGFCDNELDKGIDLFTRLFEPALMAVIGVIVGAIVFLLYMPIFQLAGSVE